MLGFPSALKVYLATSPVDMRKQFNGLWTLAEDKMKEDPRQGALFNDNLISTLTTIRLRHT